METLYYYVVSFFCCKIVTNRSVFIDNKTGTYCVDWLAWTDFWIQDFRVHSLAEEDGRRSGRSPRVLSNWGIRNDRRRCELRQRNWRRMLPSVRPRLYTCKGDKRHPNPLSFLVSVKYIYIIELECNLFSSLFLYQSKFHTNSSSFSSSMSKKLTDSVSKCNFYWQSVAFFKTSERYEHMLIPLACFYIYDFVDYELNIEST